MKLIFSVIKVVKQITVSSSIPLSGKIPDFNGAH